MRRIASLLAAALMLAALPASAGAAFAPKLQIALDPAAPRAAAAITSTITQANGETAARTVRIAFPAGFGPNLGGRAGSCPGDPQNASQCPADSQIGDADAQAGAIGLSGPVFVSNDGGQLRLFVFLEGLGGLVRQRLVGVVSVRSDQRLETTFDNLPNTTTNVVTLRLEGGERALVQNPARCGSYTFDAAFTSQQGEQATAQASVDITGCPTTPSISAVRLSPRRVRVGRRVVLSWELSEATNGTRVVIERRTRHRWRRVGSLVAPGARGRNELRFRGRVAGRRLAPGAYRVSLRATNAAGRASRVARISFRVVA